MIKTEWMPPDTASRNGSPMLLNIGLPWAVVGAWNGADEKWIYADFQLGPYEGEWIDAYFELETTDRINGWMRLPETGTTKGYKR